MLAREAVRNLAATFGACEPSQVSELEMTRMYTALLDTGNREVVFTEDNFP